MIVQHNGLADSSKSSKIFTKEKKTVSSTSNDRMRRFSHLLLYCFMLAPVLARAGKCRLGVVTRNRSTCLYMQVVLDSVLLATEAVPLIPCACDTSLLALPAAMATWVII